MEDSNIKFVPKNFLSVFIFAGDSTMINDFLPIALDSNFFINFAGKFPYRFLEKQAH